jgi:exopolyphosphatase/guanosine-5'-triphosphate,3'-diphosphate pyrophosphatase
LHRYRNKREGTRFEELYALLTEKEQSEAEVVGKAMRLGSMLWISESGADGVSLEWQPKKKVLTLVLSPAYEALFGEVADARFQSLARSLGAETQVKRLAS